MAGATIRASKAGQKTAEALIEMVHLMYQNNTAKAFLLALHNGILTELRRRKITSHLRQTDAA